jgi:hypothetical protein
MLMINKKYTGLNNNIEINYLNNNWEDINILLQLEKIESLTTINNSYSRLLLNLNAKDTNISWVNILGKNKLKSRLSFVSNKINDLKLKFNKEYEDTLFKRYELTDEIVSCLYENNNYDIPVYDHVSSSTGRSKVSSGKNFLIMKKNNRKNLKSIYKNGGIYEIDIVSLEPRFFLKYFKNIEVDDVYLHVAENILNNKNSRQKIKLGLLATIYGAGYNTVKKLTGIEKSDYEKIINYFNINKVNNELSNKFNIKDKIENAYGRNLYSNTSLLNHFIQSSAADCAYRAFYNFYFKNKEKFNLIAVIHDAIIIDVPFENIPMIEDTYCINEDKLNINLPVTVRRIS